MSLSADEEFEFELIVEICNNLYDKSVVSVWSSETGPLLDRLNQLNRKQIYGERHRWVTE